jgi:uncharacterized Zn-finger protein
MASRTLTPASPLATPTTVATPATPEVIVVETHRVMCDGGGGALGHPKVWYELGADGVAECGYCDRRFVLADRAQGH